MPSKVMFYDTHGNLKSIDEILKISDGRELAVIDHFLAEAHEGHGFTFNTVDSALADGGNIVVAFKTGILKEYHMLLVFTTLVGGYIELWEDATWTTNTGTATAIINRKRTDPVPSTLLEDKTYTPAFMQTGNVLVGTIAGMTLVTVSAASLQKRYAWGERGKVEAGMFRNENEFLLKADTQYAVVFTAIGAANKAEVMLNWAER